MTTWKNLNVTCGSAVDKQKLGFLQPIQINQDVIKFMNCSDNDVINKIQFSYEICNYIKNNNLQNSDNEREFFINDTLRKLLKLDNETTLEYAQIQHIITNHF